MENWKASAIVELTANSILATWSLRREYHSKTAYIPLENNIVSSVWSLCIRNCGLQYLGTFFHILLNNISFTILTLKWKYSSVNNCIKQIWMEMFRFRALVSDLHSEKLACLFISVDINLRKFMFIFWCLLSGCYCSKHCPRLKSTKCQLPKKIICFLHRWGLPNIISNPQLLASSSAKIFYFNFLK